MRLYDLLRTVKCDYAVKLKQINCFDIMIDIDHDNLKKYLDYKVESIDIVDDKIEIIIKGSIV